MYQPPAQHGILRGFGRALKSHCCMRLESRGFDAAKLRVMAALQVEQMSAIVHYGDDYVPVIAPGFCFCRSRDALGIIQSEHGFAGHGYLSPNAAIILSRI